jgi:phosphoribosyl-ATP pyrophosphohydrolase
MELESGEESNESADAAQSSTASNVPNTGDSTNLLFWLVLLLASGLCIACIMVDLKQKKAHK